MQSSQVAEEVPEKGIALGGRVAQRSAREKEHGRYCKKNEENDSG